jgi:hypothetical protein
MIGTYDFEMILVDSTYKFRTYKLKLEIKAKKATFAGV